MSKYYLAIDIGASSGRHMLGWIEDGTIRMEEIHRFANGMTEKNGHLCWDTQALFTEILAGMKKCADLGRIPASVGIDTWGVDFVLLDENDRMLGDAVGYRDARTEGMDEKIASVLSPQELYARSGIQKQMFNTIYQLEALKCTKPQLLKEACTLLLMPDYFHFLLTGQKVSEYTNATTTQLLDPVTKDWDRELIDLLGFPQKIFMPIKMSGTKLGHLTEKMKSIVGYDCEVVLPATHDTGSAVMAVPDTGEDVLYISSGTWSLMGVERMEADLREESRIRNFTNEGGYQYRFRYLKNIMGLWMIQSVRKEIASELSFAQISDAASKEKIASMVNVNDDRFYAPKHMTSEIQEACRETGQQVPENIAQIAAVIYRSLAACYASTVEEIESLTGKTYHSIHVIGGGSNAAYLNELTAQAANREVLAGPAEATAIGNLIAQMMEAGEYHSLEQAREAVSHSFGIITYKP